jgi:predicted dehydrogenase
MPCNRISRRQLLTGSLKAAAAAVAFAVVPRHVLGGAAGPAPSDVLRHGIIGVGGMGNGHVGYVLGDSGARLMAISDVDADHLAKTLKRCPETCKGYKDFRELLDRGDIDIVHIATPPHWHAVMSVMAAEAGCDIWCEKPMTRTIGEARPVVEAVQRYGRMFRLNTWFRLHSQFYGFGTPVKPIKQLVASGLLGWPLTVRVSRFTGFDWKVKAWSGRTHLEPQPVPPQFDYDFWLGPAPVKPYHPHRTHGSFRGYWDYDGGGLADMGQHYLDPVQYILGKDDTSPVDVRAWAPWPTHPDAVGIWGRVEMRYEDGCRIILESGDWGVNQTEGQPYIEGPKGKLYKGLKTEPAGLADALPTLPQPEPQISEFAESVRTRRKFGLCESNGLRSNLLVHLANCAIRTGRELRFDPVGLHFVGDEEANRLADQPMRAPWHL